MQHVLRISNKIFDFSVFQWTLNFELRLLTETTNWCNCNNNGNSNNNNASNSDGGVVFGLHTQCSDRVVFTDEYRTRYNNSDMKSVTVCGRS